MRIVGLIFIALLSGACAEPSATPEPPPMNSNDTARTEPNSALAGAWTLRSGAGRSCRLILSDQVAQARAGGSVPPPMQGVRQEGDCGLATRVSGWRSTANGGLELVDPYGRGLVTLTRRDAVAYAGAGLTLTRD